MIDRRLVFDIHRLNNSGLSRRQIALQLRLDRKTVGKYLDNPDLKSKPRKKQSSKLDPFRDKISEMVDAYQDVVVDRYGQQGANFVVTIE